MGLSAFGALVAIALAFLAQSPRLLARLNLGGQRFDLRAKSFTGYGLALLLLAMGFFLAGVPLDRGVVAEGTLEETAAVDGVAVLPEDEDATGATEPEGTAASNTAGGQSGAMVGLPTSPSGGASGAMNDLSTPESELETGEVITGTAEIPLPPGAGTEEGATTTAAETPEPTDAPTRTPTETPTPTPSPTPSPTPILMPTARINDETSTLPMRRLPGGPVLVVLVRGDTVIPLTGNAFYDGELWQEIQTVSGLVGWVQERFLDYGASGE